MPDYSYDLANNIASSANNLRLLNAAAGTAAAINNPVGMSRNGKKF